MVLMQRPPRRRIRKLVSYTLDPEEIEAVEALAKKCGKPKSRVIGDLVMVAAHGRAYARKKAA